MHPTFREIHVSVMSMVLPYHVHTSTVQISVKVSTGNLLRNEIVGAIFIFEKITETKGYNHIYPATKLGFPILKMI